MTNYNERLDETLSNFRQSSLIINANNSLGAGEKGREAFIQSLDEAKQALTSLIKELVAEALKELKEEVIGEVPSKINTDNWKYDRRVAELKLWQHQAIDQKLKALEEV